MRELQCSFHTHVFHTIDFRRIVSKLKYLLLTLFFKIKNMSINGVKNMLLRFQTRGDPKSVHLQKERNYYCHVTGIIS